MKTYLAIVMVLLCCGLNLLRAEDDSEMLLPSSRKVMVLPDAERNPYAKVEEPKVEPPVATTDGTSEEGLIESVLNGLTVVGRTRGAAGWKVLLGDMILERGKTLPPVVAGQTHVLRVAAIHESMIEIEWVNEDPRAVPKRMFIMVQLKPNVSTALSGRSVPTNRVPPPKVITRPQPDDSSPER